MHHLDLFLGELLGMLNLRVFSRRLLQNELLGKLLGLHNFLLNLQLPESFKRVVLCGDQIHRRPNWLRID